MSDDPVAQDVKAAITTLETMLEEVDDRVHNPAGNITRPHHYRDWLDDCSLALVYRTVIADLADELKMMEDDAEPVADAEILTSERVVESVVSGRLDRSLHIVRAALAQRARFLRELDSDTTHTRGD